ncbi:hypothetical protein [Psychrobacillus sp. FSL K6-2843]|uniref:hypothetical protein n=1 Tax=Psychrobacillus sp. FSL K6-2843 TaxID=2921549 RepID=UPI0031599B31
MNDRKDDYLNGTITHFMGKSYTGQGVKNFYKELIQEAKKVYFFKGPASSRLSETLKEIGYAAIRRGNDMEWFLDPLDEDAVEAVYIVDTKTLYLQTNTIDPFFYGAGHEWVTYYDAYKLDRLRDVGLVVRDKHLEGEAWLAKGLQTLSKAKLIHDDWEQLIQPGMDWKGIDSLLDDLKKKYIGNVKLQKNPKLTHRLMGSLTPLGAKDTFSSISKSLKTRLYIKGLPGSGKSSFMKKFGEEAKSHGLDVRYIWCGLDANSIDGVVIPELQLSIVDATSPHIYDPEREGDEIVDFFPYIDQNQWAEEELTKVREAYSSEMELAQDYISTYFAEAKLIKSLYDSAIDEDKWRELHDKMLETIE